MKKIILAVVAVLAVAGAIGAWLLLGPATAFPEKKRPLYIATNAATKEAVLDSLLQNSLIKNTGIFSWLATQMNYWATIKPGKYDIEKGTSLLTLVRKLRNGQQSPVNLVITKLRTPEDLAKLIGRKFETDSASMMAYLQSDSFKIKRGITKDESLAFVLPDTYTYFWNTAPEKIFQKLVDANQDFWTQERKDKAAAKGLTQMQATILASIVDEETNAAAEKGTIASVYINRLRLGMPLQADPTVKYALKDFSIKRIYEKHLAVASPYNTYRNRGLPPGPICTPQQATIDAVLQAPQTAYIYFVASPQFNGTHEFSATYAEHQQKAKKYQQALTAFMEKQAQKNAATNAQ